MISDIERRSRALSKEIASWPKTTPKTKQKPKDLDFLNRLTGLNIPKRKEPPRISTVPTVITKVVERKVFMGKPGKDGEDGKHGHTPTKSELLQLIHPLIPEVKDGQDGMHGKTPIKGIDYLTQEEINQLKEEIRSEIKLPESIKGDMPEIDEEFVRSIIKKMKILPEKDRLEIQDIRNASSFMYKGTKYQVSELMHGGGSSSSSGATYYTPTGTVNAVNTVFTVTAQPTSVISDGILYFENVGYTYAALTITLTIPPSQYIRYTL